MIKPQMHSGLFDARQKGLNGALENRFPRLLKVAKFSAVNRLFARLGIHRARHGTKTEALT